MQLLTSTCLLLLGLGDKCQAASKLNLGTDKVGKVCDGERVLQTLLDTTLVVGAAS